VTVIDYRNDQLERAARRVFYSNAARYKARGEFLFDGIPLAGAHVLEVGCGGGTWAIWAALNGAENVIGIDPEARGSSAGDFATFQQTIKLLGLTGKVTASDQFLEELPAQQEPFDVVIMYDVINHLDEAAVVVLDRDAAAYESYVNALQRLRSRMRAGAWLIVADCARDNFWVRLGLRSPFASNIAWQKHQNPEMWINVFKQSRFEYSDLRWSYFYPFRRFTSNWLTQYLTCSHFVLRLRAA